MITATVDNRDVMRKLNKLEQMTGKPLEKLVTQSVRRVCVNLSRATAPFGFSDGAKKSGEGAIKWDYGVSTLARERGYLEMVADTFGTKQINQILTRKDGTQYVIDWQEITFSASQVASHHKSRRNKKSGRVGGGLSVQGDQTKDIGRWRNDVKMVTTHEIKEKAMQKALKRVGLAKHAYAQAAKMVGGPRGITAPWVKKSKGVKGIGVATIRKSRAGYIGQIESKLTYASRVLSASSERKSLQRESDYLTQQVEREMDKRWKG
jgi:hypothetical protein